MTMALRWHIHSILLGSVRVRPRSSASNFGDCNSMTARIILNPYSGRYTGRQRWPEAQAALDAAGFAYELASTERPGHARELARDAALAGCSPIVAAGGDGTV